MDYLARQCILWRRSRGLDEGIQLSNVLQQTERGRDTSEPEQRVGREVVLALAVRLGERGACIEIGQLVHQT